MNHNSDNDSRKIVILFAWIWISCHAKKMLNPNHDWRKRTIKTLIISSVFQHFSEFQTLQSKHEFYKTKNFQMHSKFSVIYWQEQVFLTYAPT